MVLKSGEGYEQAVSIGHQSQLLQVVKPARCVTCLNQAPTAVMGPQSTAVLPMPWCTQAHAADDLKRHICDPASLVWQGVICFESVMAAAEESGQIKGGKPIICKPSRAVRLAHLTVCTLGHIHGD